MIEQQQFSFLRFLRPVSFAAREKIISTPLFIFYYVMSLSLLGFFGFILTRVECEWPWLIIFIGGIIG